MAAQLVRPGDKVEIRITLEVAQENKTGTKARVFQSQLLDVKENGDLEMAMPFNGTKIVLLPLELRYEFIFITRGGMYKAEGKIVERYKSENVFMILVHLQTSITRFQRRQYFRWACTMDVFFWKITEEQAKLPEVSAIVRELTETDEIKHQVKAKTVDISGGGARFQTGERLEENQYLLMVIHLKSEDRDQKIMIPGRVLATEEVRIPPNTMFQCRISFVNSNKKLNEAIVQFVFSEERKYRNRGYDV